ncbi:MAG: response regulator [Sphingobacteriales bacterium JAD_PAG50586_3]|nr:MAG: response regulator [Sphingobacteriales bacterium JAD_PAG50586_3]
METPQRFLLIDDDPSNNLLTKISIKKVIDNAEVIAHTMPEAGIQYIIDEYAANPVQTVLFLDINMPTLSGWDVLDKFAEIPELIVPNFTIYVLSSSVDPSDKAKAASNNLVAGYLEKPLSREVLKSMFQLA